MYQSITVVGRLGRDPEMRYMPNGDPVTSFNMATDRTYNDKGGQRQKETTWFRVSVFGKQAEAVNKFAGKGKMVLVEGRLQVDAKTGGPRTYTRQDGTIGSSFEIYANNIRFLSPREDGQDAGGASEGGDGTTHDGGDNIPF